MKTFDVPDWITVRFLANGVAESDYYLYGAGRALGFVRTAAHTLDESSIGEETLALTGKAAEYHAYVGVSASRTAIDAIASWLYVSLELGSKLNAGVNLSREEFREKVLEVHPAIKESVLALGRLGKLINKQRQRAQHQEGLAILHHLESKDKGHPGGWYLAPEGLSGDRKDDVHLTELLNSWADEIEANMRAIHESLA